MADLKLELSVIGSMINDEPCKVLGLQKITNKEQFEHEIPQLLYNAIYELFITQTEVDIFTVSDYLKKKKKFDFVGNDLYKDIVSNRLNIPNFEVRLKSIKDDYIYRTQVKVATDIFNKAKDRIIPPDELALEAISVLEKSISNEGNDSSKPVGLLLKDLMYKLESNEEKQKGLTTGYEELDKYFTLLEGNLITISARSSAGKTAFLLQILRRLAFLNNVPTAVFSLEMRADAYVTRIASAHLRINSYAFKNNMMSNSDKDRFHDFVASFPSVPLFIDDNPDYDVHSILAKIVVLAITKNIKVFAIDYLTLVKLHYENRQTTKSDAIGYFTFALKKIARKLNVTIIILQQLNKELDKRPNPRPIIGDLKDSGSIENDSDVVVLLYRPDMYPQNIFEATTKDEKDNYGHLNGKYILFHKLGRETTTIDVSGKCEVIIAKNREGSTGRLYFDFNMSYGGFEYNKHLSSIINNKQNEYSNENIF